MIHGWCASTLACALAVSLAVASPAQEQPGAPTGGIETARSRIYPALVNISVVSRAYAGGRVVRRRSAGSGTVISAEGHVLTNYHVARDATRLICTLTTGERIAADLVGEDPATDLSVLKLRLAERERSGAPLVHATMGDSDRIRVGDPVIAVGNPLSLSSSMTLGIVSNPRRVFTRDGRIEEFDFGGGNKTGMFTVWIQHDALILPGNSGGPLVNLAGEIIGVNTRAGSGYGFAAPSKLVQRVVDQILAHGEVRRGWLGLALQPVEPLGRTTGVLVASVAAGSPAAEGGVEPGDVLLSLGGEPATCRFLEQIPTLYDRIANLTVGERVEAVVERGGESKTLSLAVGRMAAYVGEQVELPELGATIQNITPPMMRARRYPHTDGVVVTGIRAGEPLEEARPRMRAGDVILAIGGRPTPDIRAFRAALETIDDDEIPVTFRRDRARVVTLVDTKRTPRRKPGGELPKPWLGVRTQVVTPKVAKALGLSDVKGFRITEVYPGTRAHAAGLRAGDILTSLDDEALDASRPQDARELRNRIENLTIGMKATLGVLRGAETLAIEVELEESPASASDAKTAKSEAFEFEVRDCTFMDRIRKDLRPEQRGVLVTEVASGGWASIANLAPGDVLMAVGDRAVPDIAAFRAAMKAVEDARPAVVKLFVVGGAETRFVFIEPEWQRGERR